MSPHSHPPIIGNELHGRRQIQRPEPRIGGYSQHDMTLVHVAFFHARFFRSENEGQSNSIPLQIIPSQARNSERRRLVRLDELLEEISRVAMGPLPPRPMHVVGHSRAAPNVRPLQSLLQSGDYFGIFQNVRRAAGTLNRLASTADVWVLGGDEGQIVEAHRFSAQGPRRSETVQVIFGRNDSPATKREKTKKGWTAKPYIARAAAPTFSTCRTLTSIKRVVGGTRIGVRLCAFDDDRN